MNESTRRALDRVDDVLDRAGRREKKRRGFSTAPIVLVLGLILAYQLLVRLVPMLWAEILPEGYDQAAFLPGGARLVRGLGLFCYGRFPIVLGGVVAVVLVSVALGRHPATRPLVWLMAVASILANAGILFVALKAGMDAAGIGQILG
jgi:hypothetical protein